LKALSAFGDTSGVEPIADIALAPAIGRYWTADSIDQRNTF
jgi:hypothetical protein